MDSAAPNPIARPLTWKKVSFGTNTYFDIFFVVLGGLPLYLPLILALGETAAGAQQPIPWAYWANLIISMPHTTATYARLTRKIGEGKVNWWLGWPAYMMVLAFLIFATAKGFFVEVFTLVNVWQSYHYLRQVYGVSRYLGRSAEETERSRKLVFWSYHLAIPLFTLGRWDLLYTVWNGKASPFIIPLNIPDPIMNICWVAAGVGLCMGLYGEILKYKNSREEYDATGILCLAVYYVIHWFGFISREFYMRGFIVITIFHAMQYIGMIFLLEEKQKSTPTYVVKRLLDIAPHGLAFLLFIGALFFIGLTCQDYVFTLPNLLWAQFSASCLSSISAHHYLVDSFMWSRKAGT